jgi:hypothetical protein
MRFPLSIALLAVVLLAPIEAQPPARPSLVVLLVVDQMRRDYIDDYGPKWKKGLRRLVDEGAWFTNAAYPYSTTLTCAGHATIAVVGPRDSAGGVVHGRPRSEGGAVRRAPGRIRR